MRWLDGVIGSVDVFEQTGGGGVVKDREAWRAAVHGFAKSRRRLSD